MADEADLLDHPPVVISQSQDKLGLLLLGCLAFCVIGIWEVHQNVRDWEAWFALVFFGFCALAILGQRIRPGKLKVGPAGIDLTLFAFRSMKTTHYDWTDIDHFDVISIGRGTMAGWYFTPSYVPKSKAGKVLLGVSGHMGGLSGSWTLSKQELVELLSRAQTRWGKMSTKAGVGPHILRQL